ncbi:hypothetical protein [Trinickia diaoshuihuensis]|jgi:hypothetical protein|uniref:hypothetical protein n=1 Tax=Trinickia diaoshuihuensis TaxID=2292265 RepID=UPI0013C2B247|nr:hypothetical protein [Trinickia diaoshuihuensis]
MEPSMIGRVRANLLVAALAASLVQISSLLSILLFRVPERVFVSEAFRLEAMSFVVCMVIAAHIFANAAFHAAQKNGHLTVWGGRRGAVSLSPRCPHLSLVVLHLRFVSRRIVFLDDFAGGV